MCERQRRALRGLLSKGSNFFLAVYVGKLDKWPPARWRRLRCLAKSVSPREQIPLSYRVGNARCRVVSSWSWDERRTHSLGRPSGGLAARTMRSAEPGVFGHIRCPGLQRDLCLSAAPLWQHFLFGLAIYLATKPPAMLGSVRMCSIRRWTKSIGPPRAGVVERAAG